MPSLKFSVKKHPKTELKLLTIIKDLVEFFSNGDVDVCDLTHADPLLLYTVSRKSKLLSGDQKDYDKLQRLAFHKYSDYLPYLKMEDKHVKERIKSYATA